jgi:hypothetical protein
MVQVGEKLALLQKAVAEGSPIGVRAKQLDRSLVLNLPVAAFGEP